MGFSDLFKLRWQGKTLEDFFNEVKTLPFEKGYLTDVSFTNVLEPWIQTRGISKWNSFFSIIPALFELGKKEDLRKIKFIGDFRVNKKQSDILVLEDSLYLSSRKILEEIPFSSISAGFYDKAKKEVKLSLSSGEILILNFGVFQRKGFNFLESLSNLLEEKGIPIKEIKGKTLEDFFNEVKTLSYEKNYVISDSVLSPWIKTLGITAWFDLVNSYVPVLFELGKKEDLRKIKFIGDFRVNKKRSYILVLEDSLYLSSRKILEEIPFSSISAGFYDTAEKEAKIFLSSGEILILDIGISQRKGFNFLESLIHHLEEKGINTKPPISQIEFPVKVNGEDSDGEDNLAKSKGGLLGKIFRGLLVVLVFSFNIFATINLLADYRESANATRYIINPAIRSMARFMNGRNIGIVFFLWIGFIYVLGWAINPMAYKEIKEEKKP